MKKRHTYNEALLRAIDYSTPAGVRKAIKRLLILEGLAYCGDMVAASIMADIKRAIGIEERDFNLFKVLTPKQRYAIIRVLVEDQRQIDVAREMGISQQGVSYLISGGVQRVRRFLLTGRRLEDDTTCTGEIILKSRQTDS